MDSPVGALVDSLVAPVVLAIYLLTSFYGPLCFSRLGMLALTFHSIDSIFGVKTSSSSSVS